MSTCNRLHLQTLGSQPMMPKNLPDHCFTLRSDLDSGGLWDKTLKFKAMTVSGHNPPMHESTDLCTTWSLSICLSVESNAH